MKNIRIVIMSLILLSCLSVCNTIKEESQDSQEDSVAVVKTPILCEAYYQLEVDSNGEVFYPALDPINELCHLQFKQRWCHKGDSVEFDMIVNLYMDTVYPHPDIQDCLFKMIDKHMIDGLSYDIEYIEKLNRNICQNDLAVWFDQIPSSKKTSWEYLKSWELIMNRLNQKYGMKSFWNGFHEIQESMSFVLCHKVYEDSQNITYVVERGNSAHGGYGAMCYDDYLTFDKESGRRLTGDDLVKDSIFENVNNVLYRAYLIEAKRKSHDSKSLCNLVEKADGIALLDDGILFYYHPYSIGSGAEGQYNLLIVKSISTYLH